MLRRNGSKGWVLEIRNNRKVYERKDCHSCNLRDSYVMRIRKTIKGGRAVKSKFKNCGRWKKGKVLSDFFLPLFAKDISKES